MTAPIPIPSSEPLSKCRACGHLRHWHRPCWSCARFARWNARIDASDAAVVAESQRQLMERHRQLATHFREVQAERHAKAGA